jgi:hypothetical protein
MQEDDIPDWLRGSENTVEEEVSVMTSDDHVSTDQESSPEDV